MADLEKLRAQLAGAKSTARKRAITALAKLGSAEAAAAIVAAMQPDSDLIEFGANALRKMGAVALSPTLDGLPHARGVVGSWLLGTIAALGAGAIEPLRER